MSAWRLPSSFTPQLLQNAASGGVRERAERDMVVGLSILHHTVQYNSRGDGMQWEASARCGSDPLNPDHPFDPFCLFLHQSRASSNPNGWKRIKRMPRIQRIAPSFAGVVSLTIGYWCWCFGN